MTRATNFGVAASATIEILADGRNVMLIERFDREPAARGLARRHMVSALTMLGVHDQQSQDQSYGAMAEVISRRGSTHALRTDREELFDRMVFNILVSNDDGHLRNHAFLFDAAADDWRLSPLHDVVPRPQSGTERKLHLSVGRAAAWPPWTTRSTAPASSACCARARWRS